MDAIVRKRIEAASLMEGKARQMRRTRHVKEQRNAVWCTIWAANLYQRAYQIPVTAGFTDASRDARGTHRDELAFLAGHVLKSSHQLLHLSLHIDRASQVANALLGIGLLGSSDPDLFFGPLALRATFGTGLDELRGLNADRGLAVLGKFEDQCQQWTDDAVVRDDLMRWIDVEKYKMERPVTHLGPVGGLNFQ